MKKTTLIILFILLHAIFPKLIFANVKLPAIVSSNMVLQRDTTVKLWGWADAGEKITIKLSWIEQDIKIEADSNGNWMTKVQTTLSKSPQSINIKSNSSNINLNNILFGEVWLCSGQSNMQQPLKGYMGQPTFGGMMATATSNNPNLRLFTVERVSSDTPLSDIEKFNSWQQASPETVLDFSAVAYFFGQQLQDILDVPVGLIHTSWGGSSVQAWMSSEVINQYPEINLDDKASSNPPNRTPTKLFNAMIHPLIPYTIKGALWYQGESNRLEPEHYKKLFPAMVKDWRDRWQIGDFPFYYVQIAPFTYQDKDTQTPYVNSAFIRETQLQCLNLIPNSGIAITLDLGDEYCIHPPKKKEVADRLLLNALNKTYGYETIDCNSPTYESLEIKDHGILLHFENAETGLYTPDTLSGFEIAGSDKVFYPAEAKIINRKNVFVKSKEVPNPVAVRYAWKNWIIGSLYDVNMLPASSFRTDDWDDAKNN
ncbi:sialate O-acetylesterase [Aestuariibaculum sediminum]|uniref:Sialate O-acetylesterase n=1 Tax=Aestuariibaculum sediminum TaxID=2770637 RepID=A0A8J6U9N1_9FLAO|nr:sialate O-acetylesterase [Aestuariibaculum sediminum]MBD0833402.1 sialate O-acetylesterase [Aestuariibaculum sediminum]